MARIFHESRGIIFHGGALLYAVTGYAVGLYGLFSDNWLVNFFATLWLAHANGAELSDRWQEALIIKGWVEAIWEQAGFQA